MNTFCNQMTYPNDKPDTFEGVFKQWSEGMGEKEDGAGGWCVGR